MILYYALGGGLGHISRSFALIARAPQALRENIRLLVSSEHAHVARPHAPCPMDAVPHRATVDRKLYHAFLADYLQRYACHSLILDTFPFGLVGEWKHAAPDLPRFLIGRYLRWDVYRERCGNIEDACWPNVSFMIEEQEGAYMEIMARHSRIITANVPISILEASDAEVANERHADSETIPACCAIVHSGPAEEIRCLTQIAERVIAERRMDRSFELFTPDMGMFPMERHLLRFSDVVTGAGYAACAAAASMRRVRYHLHPFSRRFDDQALRLKRLSDGRWGNPAHGNASTAAAILWKGVLHGH